MTSMAESTSASSLDEGKFDRTNLNFEYIPLNSLSPSDDLFSIRLFELLPSEPDAIIQGRLIHTTLATATNHLRPRFTNSSQDRKAGFAALSYEWGPPTSALALIRLDGQSFAIRPNLHTFLYQIRKQCFHDLPLKLWIDSICINQNDLEEKASQVQAMHQIYAQAREVLVWLGDEADLSASVFYHLRAQANEMGARVPVSKKQYHGRTGIVLNIMGNTYEHHQRQAALQSETFRNDIMLRQALLKLCRRTYWTRAWIIQECLNARNVSLFCGNEHLPHAAFPLLGILCPELKQDATLWSHSSSNSGQSSSDSAHLKHLDPADRVIELTRRWYIDRHDGLESLLQSYSGSKCSSLHDKVYAFLGLSSERSEFAVDYNISLYTLLARAVIFCSESKAKRRSSTIDPVRMTCDSIHVAQLLVKDLELSCTPGNTHQSQQGLANLPDELLSKMVSVELDYLGIVSQIPQMDGTLHLGLFRVNGQTYQVITSRSNVKDHRVFALRGTPVVLIYRKKLSKLLFTGLAIFCATPSTAANELTPLITSPSPQIDDASTQGVEDQMPDITRLQIQHWTFPPPGRIPRYQLQYNQLFVLRLFRLFILPLLPIPLAKLIMTGSPDSAFYASPYCHLPLRQVLNIVSVWPERIRGYEDYCQDLKTTNTGSRSTMGPRTFYYLFTEVVVNSIHKASMAFMFLYRLLTGHIG